MARRNNTNRVKEKDLGYSQFKEIWTNNKRDGFVKVGIVGGGSQYPDGTSVADIAAFNEFGTDSIPERPFMRQTIESNSNRIKQTAKKLLTGVVSLKMSKKDALGKLGVLVSGLMKSQIVNGQFAELSPSTLKKKTPKTKPLIDTGQLRSSIDWEIEE